MRGKPSFLMKLKYLLAVGMAATLGIGLLPARTWTSADGTKTFEGDLKSYDKATGKVTVALPNGKTLTFGTDKLSDADKTFLAEQPKAAAEGGEDVAEALKEQKIGSKLLKKGILQKLDGKKFANFELTKAPQYYLVYFSASW